MITMTIELDEEKGEFVFEDFKNSRTTLTEQKIVKFLEVYLKNNISTIFAAEDVDYELEEW
jgi:hypothetical protein